MTIKCLIICANELLGEAVESLCKTQADLEVVNVRLSEDTDLMRLIEHHEPDVLILDESMDKNIHSRLLVPFVRFPDIRIIVLGMQANVLQVYRKQNVPITKTSDLLSAVRDQPINP